MNEILLCSHPIISQNSMMSSMSQIVTITSHFLRPKVPMRIGFCVGDSSRGNVEVDDNIWLADWLIEAAHGWL